MKITFVAPHIKPAGGPRAFLTYAHLLARRGHEVTVIVPVNGAFRRLVGSLLVKKPKWFANFAATLKRVDAAYHEQDIPDGDIIIATAWQTAGPVASYGPSKGKKSYLVQHYESLYHGKPEVVDALWAGPAMKLQKITISNWIKGILKEKFHSDADLILTPVDLELFHFVPEAKNKSPVRICLLDHEYKWKGTVEGARAFEVVKKDFPDIKLVLFGVRRAVTSIPHDEYHYYPQQKDLARIYSSCDIFLCPSDYEGLGMPAMEAMACKSAVVTWDTGGSRDYAFDGKTAFVAKHADFDDLVRKLKLAVSDKVLREQIAENGYKFIRTLSWENAVTRMEDIFFGAVSAKK
ncbi:MAG: hypothetical protein A2941_00535 [Candidatus Yanofskybacteria bacterium RIFCSPLOWO2_01_FULL_49_17]|uniref:Glycosyl transferase family 1 domain-containing protein n=1 Tax=Candidatus Yanofskybacteria bacterium RIFCSPLOWO2_01_FULL_49_17 TaxID=1802700 RepID=A0A1F8GR86_9BACT|nr:MAG: hypothetical protein A2941_00535 [Candidatus Yanofskybacteria bacterium RIFCSPLOWO2_01_FULL_49_17]